MKTYDENIRRCRVFPLSCVFACFLFKGDSSKFDNLSQERQQLLERLVVVSEAQRTEYDVVVRQRDAERQQHERQMETLRQEHNAELERLRLVICSWFASPAVLKSGIFVWLDMAVPFFVSR